MKIVIKLILTILLLGCLVDFPYGYYQFVRFAALVGFGYLAFNANEQGAKNEVFIYLFGFGYFISTFFQNSTWQIVMECY
jgi:hypothetical protein